MPCTQLLGGVHSLKIKVSGFKGYIYRVEGRNENHQVKTVVMSDDFSSV